MRGELDAHTSVSPQGGDRFAADLHPGWGIGEGLNGGYLLAVIGAALRAASDAKPDPLVLAATFVTPAHPGAAEVATRTVREGRSLATVATELIQDDACRITAIATTGRLADLAGDVRTTARPPDLPPPEDCLGRESAPQEPEAGFEPVRLVERYDLRLDPAVAGFAVGRPTGRGMLQGWCRLADGRAPDALALLAMVDALPPVSFDLGMGGWAPTVQLTAHLRAAPAPGWLRLRQETRNMAGGLFEQDCEVWDSTERLVAQARQLTKAPRG